MTDILISSFNLHSGVKIVNFLFGGRRFPLGWRGLKLILNIDPDNLYANSNEGRIFLSALVRRIEMKKFPDRREGKVLKQPVFVNCLFRLFYYDYYKLSEVRNKSKRRS